MRGCVSEYERLPGEYLGRPRSPGEQAKSTKLLPW